MLTHPTLDQLNQLGLFGMAKAFGEAETSAETAALTHLEWLALLLDREMTYRHDKKLAARLRYARLRQQVLVEDVDYRATRGLDRPLFQKLVAGDWIDAHDNLIVCGPTGVGKSWLACALAHQACRDDRSVLYQRIPKLFTDRNSPRRKWIACTRNRQSRRERAARQPTSALRHRRVTSSRKGRIKHDCVVRSRRVHISICYPRSDLLAQHRDLGLCLFQLSLQDR
jgi:hypothetical protein